MEIIERAGYLPINYSERLFNHFLTCYCHILISCWQIKPQLQDYIPNLISLFKNLAKLCSCFYHYTR